MSLWYGLVSRATQQSQQVVMNMATFSVWHIKHVNDEVIYFIDCRIDAH